MKRTFLFLFLAGSFVYAAPSAKAPPAKSAGTLSPQEKITHMFNRLAYGMLGDEQESWKGTTAANVDAKIKKWISAQMEPDKIDDAGVDSDLAYYPALRLSTTEARERYRTLDEHLLAMGLDKKIKDDPEAKKEIRQKIGEENLPEEIVKEMTSQRTLRAIRSKRQLQEVLVDFWYNHFNVDINKGEDKWLVPSFEQNSIRPNIWGRFEVLLKATAHDPAMLFYLDNHLSRGPNKKNESGLNENYAREILELHTLGVDGGYTQKDVTELARILTGWSIADVKKNPVFEYKDKIHDKGEKTFLGTAFPANGDGAEGERALTLIANHPSTAHFISMKLARYFVSDHPPEALVDRLARRFMATKGELKQVYWELFNSKEFWSRESYHAKIKKPSQFVFSSVRALNGDLEEKSDLPKILTSMGEELYKCPPPTGYKDTAETWVNPGALVNRLNFSLKLAANRIDGVYVQLPAVNKSLRDPKILIRQISQRVFDQPLSAATEKVVLREFNPENHEIMDSEVRPFSLVKATGLILGSPEFQRR